jgi:hypothetical protein
MLLTITALIAGAFGVAHWQRQQTLASYRRLHAEGVGFIMEADKSHWLAGFGKMDFWLRNPRTAEVYVSRVSAGHYRIGQASMSWQDATKHLIALRNKLRAIGVKNIQIWAYFGPPFRDRSTARS